jgi:hypothetical protein
MRRYSMFALAGSLCCMPASAQRPTADEQKRTMDAVRDIAIHYSSKLPDFIIAAGPGPLGKSLTIYDSREKVWHDLGAVVIHPDVDWTWMEPSWKPWFADGSRLVFFTSDGLIVSTPDGKQSRVLLRTQEPAGLAVPSPDGRAIADATFTSAPRPSGRGSAPTFYTTGIWIVEVEGKSQPRRLTGPTVSSTYDLRWLDNQHLVSDRIEQLRLPKAQLWMVDADH